MSETRVIAVIEDYIRAVTTADGELLARTFREDARMWGYLGAELVAAPIAAFASVVRDSAADLGWVGGYRPVIRSVEITGPVAVAVLEENGYQGGDFVNYFSLVLEDGRWRIAGKTFVQQAAPEAAAA